MGAAASGDRRRRRRSRLRGRLAPPLVRRPPAALPGRRRARRRRHLEQARRPERRAGRDRAAGVVARSARSGRGRDAGPTSRHSPRSSSPWADAVPTEVTGRRACRALVVGRPAGCRCAPLPSRRPGCALRSCGSASAGEGERAVDLWARVEGIDLAEHPPTVSASFDGVDLPAQGSVDATAERWAGTRFQSAAAGAVRVVAPARAGRLRRVGGGGRRPPRGPRSTCRLRSAAPPVPEPAVLGVALDGDRLVVHLDRPAEGLRLCGPGHGRARGARTRRHDRLRHPARPVRPPGVAAHRRLPPGPPRRPGRGRRRGGSGFRSRSSASDTGYACCRRVDGSRRAPPRAAPRRRRARVLRAGATAGGVRRRRAGRPIPTAGTSRASPAVRPPTPRWRSSRSCAVGVPSSPRPGGSSTTGTPRRAGARPVVIGSREWYDVLGTARVLVTNTEPEEWYRRRPDQLVVQCFHGYPSKAMGRSQWEARELPPRRMAVMRRRSVDTWDLISTPTPEMTSVYREQYGYAGPAAEHGYPRDDALRRADAEEVRALTRRRLGVRPDQTAVLYAPTWRDHLATRPRAAAMSEHLDVDAAAAALGDSHVVLLRGHRFHAPGASRPGCRRRDRPPRGQRADPGLGRRGPRLLLAAVRLRPDRAADGVPGAGPRRLHLRACAASCSLSWRRRRVRSS